LSAESVERDSPQSPRDQQCQHCGRWFSPRGIDSHEANCDFAGYDAVLVPIAGDGRDGAAPSAEGATQTPDSTDEDGSSPGPEPVDADPVERSRTDGGPRSPPTPSVDGASQDDDADEDSGCPVCGSDEWFDPTELPDGVLEERPVLATFDRGCYPCSTDEQGEMTQSIEVYNA